MRHRLVFWDIDGTLMHCGSNGTLALNRTFLELYGIEDAFERVGIGRSMDAVILDSIMRAFHISAVDRDRILERYIGNLRDILGANPQKRILPGVRELLDYIDGHPTLYNGLLTSNFKRGAHAKLDSVNILHYFHIGGYGDVCGEKWDAALSGLDAAREHFGIDFMRSDTFVIGDSAYDIDCAKRLGMVSIGVATGWTDIGTLRAHGPDHLFEDLSDVETIIDIIGSDE